MKLEWHESLEIGIAAIDQEHKSIVDNFVKLYELMKDGRGHEYYKDLLQFLREYVTIHFEHEEALQKRLRYPYYEDHLNHHNAFKEEVDEMIKSHQLMDVKDIDLVKLNLFIKEWLINHIMKEDMALGQYYLEQKKD